MLYKHINSFKGAWAPALFTTILFSQSAGAQDGIARTFVYSDIAPGLGFPSTFKISANCLFLKHHEIGVGYNSFWRKGKEVPADFKESTFLNFSLFPVPQEFLTGTVITYGYVLYDRKHAERIRYLLRGGLLIGNKSEPYGFYPSAKSSFGDNYQYYRRDEPAIAFIVNPCLHYSPAKAFGLSIGVFGIVSEHFAGAGIAGGMLLGKVSNKYWHKAPKKRDRQYLLPFFA